MPYAAIATAEYRINHSLGFKKNIGARVKRYRKMLVASGVTFEETPLPPGVPYLPTHLRGRVPESTLFQFTRDQAFVVFTWNT